jgi:hypothetical protein
MGPYEVNGTVGFDEPSQRYRAWAFNSLGIAIEYTGVWTDDVTLVFTSISNTARVTYTRRVDGSIRLLSERRSADRTFEAYFESILTRRQTAIERITEATPSSAVYVKNTM